MEKEMGRPMTQGTSGPGRPEGMDEDAGCGPCWGVRSLSETQAGVRDLM